MHNGWMSGEWGHISPFMGIFMLLFWGLVIFGVITAVRALTRSRDDRGALPHETPLEILNKRYASGEIDQEEYQRIKKDLE